MDSKKKHGRMALFNSTKSSYASDLNKKIDRSRNSNENYEEYNQYLYNSDHFVNNRNS